MNWRPKILAGPPGPGDGPTWAPFMDCRRVVQTSPHESDQLLETAATLIQPAETLKRRRLNCGSRQRSWNAPARRAKHLTGLAA